MGWHIHRWKYLHSKEIVVKIWPNGARKTRLDYSEKCVLCGKIKRRLGGFPRFYGPGEQTKEESHESYMKEMKQISDGLTRANEKLIKMNEKLKSEINEIQKSE